MSVRPDIWARAVDGDPCSVPFSRLMGGAIGGFTIRSYDALVNVLVEGER